MLQLHIVNLGGEGEVPEVLNQQGAWTLQPNWRSCRTNQTLQELQADGHVFVISDNRFLPFASGTYDTVITNAVPIDRYTWLGAGIQSSEVERILRRGGQWVHDGVVVYVKS